jgi:hypothetical protein
MKIEPLHPVIGIEIRTNIVHCDYLIFSERKHMVGRAKDLDASMSRKHSGTVKPPEQGSDARNFTGTRAPQRSISLCDPRPETNPFRDNAFDVAGISKTFS